MLTRISRIINRFLVPFGIKVQRTRWAGLQEQYDALVLEAYNCYCTYVFPELPQVAGRVELLRQTVGGTISEGVWMLDALHRSLTVEGDICEFGVAAGQTSALLANEIRDTGKSLWLFDSFQGLSRPTEKDVLIHDMFKLGSMAAYAGRIAHPATEVQNRLQAIAFPEERVHIVPGFIEQTIRGDHLPGAISFAYVDFDLYEPILTALNFLADHLMVGGYVVVDDYGFFSAGAKTAVDEFLAAHGRSFRATFPPDWCSGFVVLHKYAENR